MCLLLVMFWSFFFFFQLHINHENYVLDRFGSCDCIGNFTFYWARWVNGQDAQNQWCISWTDWKENSNEKMKMSRDSADFGNLVSVFEIYRKFLELENVSLSMRVNFQKLTHQWGSFHTLMKTFLRWIICTSDEVSERSKKRA